MKNLEDLNYFRSEFICPHCESDLLNVGVRKEQVASYYYNEVISQFEMSDVEETSENYICGNCSIPLPYEITEKLEFN